VQLRPTERKNATVLFIGVESSMQLASSIEREDWWSVICDLVERMCECVFRFGGWIANFTCDGIAAVFEDHHQHAQQARDAALSVARRSTAAPASRCARADSSSRFGLA
jgi:class 3 adenylate cyclase